MCPRGNAKGECDAVPDPLVDPADQRAYRAAGWWRDATFFDDLIAGAQAHPAEPAVTALRAATRATTTLSWSELLAATERCAAALTELGVRRGDPVAIMLTNRWELAPLMLGCLRIGAIINPLMPMYRRRELAVMLDLVQPVVIITVTSHDDFLMADLIVDLAREVPSLGTVLVSGDTRPEGTLDFESYVFRTPWEERVQIPGTPCGADEVCLVLFTSGTTGDPKGVRHTPNTLHAAIRGEADVYGLDDSLVMTASAVFTHYTGIVQGMFMPVMTGGRMVFTDSTHGADMLALIAEHGTTFLYGAPVVMRDLLDAHAASPVKTPALRHIVSGSSPVPPHYITEVREQFGLQLHALWGMSENGPVTMTRDTDPPNWAAHSDGSPVADMQWRIKVPDPLPEGRADDVGELWVKGPTQCVGYHRRPDAYAAKLDDQGFFATGDLARPDGRDGIRITGRQSDVILRRAFVMHTSEFEALIAAHPKVREVAVIGIPDGRGDEIVHAVVASTPQAREEPLRLEELRTLMAEQHVADMYWPTHLHLVDALPRTATGKVIKADLEQRYA